MSFQFENNAQTTSEHLQKYFLEVQKTTFLAPTMVKSRVPILGKVSIYGCLKSEKLKYYCKSA